MKNISKYKKYNTLEVICADRSSDSVISEFILLLKKRFFDNDIPVFIYREEFVHENGDVKSGFVVSCRQTQNAESLKLFEICLKASEKSHKIFFDIYTAKQFFDYENELSNRGAQLFEKTIRCILEIFRKFLKMV